MACLNQTRVPGVNRMDARDWRLCWNTLVSSSHLKCQEQIPHKLQRDCFGKPFTAPMEVENLDNGAATLSRKAGLVRAAVRDSQALPRCIKISRCILVTRQK